VGERRVADLSRWLLRTLLASPRSTPRRSFAEVVLAVALAVLAVAASLALSMLLILALGGHPVHAVDALASGAFGDRPALTGTLLATIPLTLVALGWIVALAARRINIGFEGQILMGGTLAAFVGADLHGLPTPIHLPLAILAGIAAGGAFAAIAALLWRYRGVNEIISTLLLNFVAGNLVDWLVNGPLQEPTHSVPFGAPITRSAAWPHI
jgi:simple sugar transport system permease protein